MHLQRLALMASSSRKYGIRRIELTRNKKRKCENGGSNIIHFEIWTKGNLERNASSTWYDELNG